MEDNKEDALLYSRCWNKAVIKESIRVRTKIWLLLLVQLRDAGYLLVWDKWTFHTLPHPQSISWDSLPRESSSLQRSSFPGSLPPTHLRRGKEKQGFHGGSEVKMSACNAGDLGSIPGLGRSPGEGNGNPFQYSCLESPMDRGDWWATVHGVAKSRAQLSDFTITYGIFVRWTLCNGETWTNGCCPLNR